MTMTASDWEKQIEAWRETFDLTGRSVADDGARAGAATLLDGLGDIASFYEASNGLRSDWFNILPIQSKTDIKNTWDSLNRANDAEVTRFLGNDSSLLDRFLVFAEISGGFCACIDREDSSIWFEDEDGIHQTDLDLADFIETTLKEVAEL